MTAFPSLQTQIWPIDKLVFYARNPRKNDTAVDRMCSSIKEFGFKIPVIARSDGEVVDGHLRLKAARKLGSWPGGDINSIPIREDLNARRRKSEHPEKEYYELALCRWNDAIAFLAECLVSQKSARLGEGQARRFRIPTIPANSLSLHW